MRAAALLIAVVFLASGCSDDKPASVGSGDAAEVLKKDCADPQWKEKNLGLWYSLCRQPMRW